MPGGGIVRFGSGQAIMRHPRCDLAVDRLAEGMAGLYGDDRRLVRRLFEFEYAVTFQIAVCLDAERQDAASAVVLDVPALADAAGLMGIGPLRRVRRFVEHMRGEEMLVVAPLPDDRRRQRLVPTAKMLAADREWLAVFHAPLLALVPDDPRYRAAVAHDPDYHRRYRRVGRTMLPLANRIMVANPAVELFMRHAAGARLLALLMVASRPDPDGWTPRGFFSTAADRSATSRVHVRNVLRLAEQAGLVAVGRGNDGQVRVMPELRSAFAVWAADALAGVDVTSAVAVASADLPLAELARRLG